MATVLMVREAATLYQVRPETALVVPVPPTFNWLECFEPDEQAAFYSELLEATAFCQRVQRWDRLTSLLESWQDRAERRAQPELQRRMVEAHCQVPRDRADVWPELREQVELIYALELSLRDFETRYRMDSDEFYRQWTADKLEHDRDLFIWYADYEHLREARARYAELLANLQAEAVSEAE